MWGTGFVLFCFVLVRSMEREEMMLAARQISKVKYVFVQVRSGPARRMPICVYTCLCDVPDSRVCEFVCSMSVR